MEHKRQKLAAPDPDRERAEPARSASDTRFEKRHELVSRILRSNIAQGHFPPGLLLLEAPLADVLQTSRAPVRKALEQLERDALVHRSEGRGFLVGTPRAGGRPIRADLRELGLLMSDEADEALQVRGSWERIAAEVECEVSVCLVFGEFRIVEAELADHYRVSRTVIRDVLSRLQERGLLRKTQNSRWIAGPLTAQAMKDRYDLRAILEPAAITAAAATLDRARLSALRRRALAIEADGTAATGGAPLFDEFLSTCILHTPNPIVAEAIRQNLLPLSAAGAALDALGLPHDEAAVSELRMIVELLLNGSTAAAAACWRDHLAAACGRSIAQLKIVAIIDRPSRLAPYLTAV